MSLEIRIGGHGACVTMEVFGYENPFAENISDSNWVSCQVKLKIREREFSVDFPASFTTHDFAQFYGELSIVVERLEGTASFVTDEQALCISVVVHGTGRGEVKGVAQVCDTPQASLNFSFESDQSFLNQTLHDLQAVIEKFPVKEY